MFDMLKGTAQRCLRDGQQCLGAIGEGPVDVTVAGFPCQPHSRQNTKRWVDGGVEGGPLCSATGAVRE
eukprot:13979159-Alexandrium_andersonii.AAC.1